MFILSTETGTDFLIWAFASILQSKLVFSYLIIVTSNQILFSDTVITQFYLPNQILRNIIAVRTC